MDESRLRCPRCSKRLAVTAAGVTTCRHECLSCGYYEIARQDPSRRAAAPFMTALRDKVRGD